MNTLREMNPEVGSLADSERQLEALRQDRIVRPQHRAQRRGNNLKGFQDFDLQVKARVWP
jgi:hypothetical protein